MFPKDESPAARWAASIGVGILVAALSITLFGILTNSTNTFESVHLRINYPDGWRVMDINLIPECNDDAAQCVLVLQQLDAPNASMVISRADMTERLTPEQLALRSRETADGNVMGTFDLTIDGQDAFGQDVLVSGERCDSLVRQIYATRGTIAYEILVLLPCEDDFSSVISTIRDMLDSLQLFGGRAI